MRPLKLKIKGLNSFVELQEIDLVKLTSKGLFGIFGPTGSGKSSILDGITLALYGEVARGSTNFVNTNCDTLQVSFEFQITEKEIKRYRVEREFRRDKKTGAVRTHSAKILLLTDAGEMVLEEQVKGVTRKCEEIIGLKLEDFTRTVVLPQGKFSEFLRLGGRERREMLERLFNLQKYGDDLSNRLLARIRREATKAEVLEGQLKLYEDCSAESLKEKTNELNSLAVNLALAKEELQKAQEHFNEGKEVWELQKELHQHEAQKAALEQRTGEIQEKARQADLGERALRVKPYLDQYEDTLQKIADTQQEVAELTLVTEQLAGQKKEAEEKLEKARLKKDQELPLLKLREQTITDALEEKAKLTGLIQERDALQAQLQELEMALKDKEARIQRGEALIAQLNEEILDKERRAESLIVDQEIKKKVNEALLILSHLQEAKLRVGGLERELQTLKEKLQEAGSKEAVLTEELKVKEELLQDKDLKRQALLKNCPGDQETLIALQEKLSQIKEQWAKHHEYEAALEKNKQFLMELQPKLSLALQCKEKLDQEIEVLEQELEKLNRESIAHGLRLALKEGDPCPVCGSMSHRLDEVKTFDTSALEEKQRLLKEKKERAQGIYQEIIKTQENIRNYEAAFKEYEVKLADLGEEYKKYDPLDLQKKFETLKEELTRYTREKDQLEKEVNSLTQERNALLVQLNEQTTIKKETALHLESRGKNLEQESFKLAALEEELNVLKTELKVENFEREQAEINRKEAEKAQLENDIKGLRETLKSYEERKATRIQEHAALKETFKEKMGIFTEKEKVIQEKEAALRAKVGDVEDLEQYQSEIAAQITRIEQDYEAAAKTQKDLEQRYNEAYTSLQASQYSLQSLQERSDKDRESLQRAMAEEQFKDIAEVRSCSLEREEIDKLKQEVKEYQDSLTQLLGAMENIRQKLGERRLTEEQWEELQKLKEEKELRVKELEESKIKLQSAVTSLQEKLAKKQELLQEQAQVEHQLALLKDLEKLFKGKRFVEFVAAHQLKYVSIEASKRLRQITGGTYGLEVDEDGKFLIRDYKNGGAQRDASTLSGGETFLASLSLALALSAQIQLKGTAPLELFFLDEGFGTLDDNLLEVVMDSLERLHNDRLSVGIISHVEAIKNRVPIKLMVTPAQAGLGGSKVTIEVS